MTGAQVTLILLLAALFIGTPLAARFAERHRSSVDDYWHDQYGERPLNLYSHVEYFTDRGYPNERAGPPDVEWRGNYPG